MGPKVPGGVFSINFTVIGKTIHIHVLQPSVIFQIEHESNQWKPFFDFMFYFHEWKICFHAYSFTLFRQFFLFLWTYFGSLTDTFLDFSICTYTFFFFKDTFFPFHVRFCVFFFQWVKNKSTGKKMLVEPHTPESSLLNRWVIISPAHPPPIKWKNSTNYRSLLQISNCIFFVKSILLRFPLSTQSFSIFLYNLILPYDITFCCISSFRKTPKERKVFSFTGIVKTCDLVSYTGGYVQGCGLVEFLVSSRCLA